MSVPNTDWSRWENHVLSELKRINGNIEKSLTDQAVLLKDHFTLKEEVGIIKARLSIYCALFGILGSFLGSGMKLVYDLVSARG
jgi:hypothetical protein